MATIKCCDLCKEPIPQNNIVELTLTDGIESNKFELDQSCYQQLLYALRNSDKVVPANTDSAVIQKTSVALVEKEEPAPAPTSKNEEDDILAQSRVFAPRTLPALSGRDAKQKAAEALRELNRKNTAAFNKKNAGDGIRFKDLSDNDMEGLGER